MATTIIQRHRDTAILLLVVVAFTGYNVWQHRNDTPAGYRQYSSNGLSFIYPADCTLREAVIIFRLPSYWQGDLQGESSSSPATIVGIVWGAGGPEGLAAFMDTIIEEARKYNEITNVSADAARIINGKEALVRGFNVGVDGDSVPGLIAGWASPEGRTFVVYCLRQGAGEDWGAFQLDRIMGSLRTEPPPQPR
jgi:hypothetical protein